MPTMPRVTPMVSKPSVAKVRMLDLDEIPSHAKVLVYGDTGAGKTFLGATAPDPVVLLTEVEVSLPTLKYVARTRSVKPKVIIVDSLDAFESAVEFLESGKHDFKTVVVDSVTDLNRMICQEMISRGVAARPTHDLDSPEPGDWYKITERTRKYILQLRNLPIHVVAICLALDMREEMFLAPSVAPKKLAVELPGLFNTVGHLEKVETPGGKEVKRLLKVEGGSQFASKNPAHALPPVVENPDLADIIPRIVEGIKVEKIQSNQTEEV